MMNGSLDNAMSFDDIEADPPESTQQDTSISAVEHPTSVIVAQQFCPSLSALFGNEGFSDAGSESDRKPSKEGSAVGVGTESAYECHTRNARGIRCRTRGFENATRSDMVGDLQDRDEDRPSPKIHFRRVASRSAIRSAVHDDRHFCQSAIAFRSALSASDRE